MVKHNGQTQTNFLSVFDHFVGLVLKGLKNILRASLILLYVNSPSVFFHSNYPLKHLFLSLFVLSFRSAELIKEADHNINLITKYHVLAEHYDEFFQL